jgi:Bacterial EndoU nuclease
MTIATNCVTTKPSQQPLNTILSDGNNKKCDYNNNQTTHTVYVPNPVTFSTEHKSFHRHTAAPQYDLNRMNTAQLAWYFHAQGYTESQILSYPGLYMNQAYLALAKQLPRYPEFVKKYHSELRAQQEQEARENKETQDRAAYICELQRVERILSDGLSLKSISTNDHTTRGDELRMAGHKARIEKIQIAQQRPERELHQLQINQEAIDFVTAYSITEQQITHVTMNSYEYQLHKEFVSHIHDTLALQKKYAVDGQNIFIDALGDGISLGIKSNHLHNPEWATRWSDFCYEATEIVQGIGEGILLGSYNAVDMVIRPVHTLVRIVDGICMLGSLTVRTIGTLAHWNYLIEHGELMQCATEMCEVGEQLDNIATTIYEHTSQMSNRKIAKHITAFGTEWVLTGQMFAMGHALCSKLGNTIKRTIKFLKNEGAAGEFVLATTDGVLLQGSKNVNMGGHDVKNIIHNTSKLLGLTITEYMTVVKAEIEIIRKVLDNKVKGFLECANKYLKPEYEHILGINPIFGRNGISKIGGFHHDYTHSFRKSGVLEFADLIKTETGFCKADIFEAGRYVDTKTFFPAHWSRKEVIEKIYSVCEDFISSGMQPILTKGDKYLIKHIIEEGVELEMYITKNGRIVTAYPVLK